MESEMAGSPRYKVFTDAGEYVASCKYPDDAAAIVAAHSIHGWRIRDGHGGSDVWIEGVDGSAGESFDEVARVVLLRVR
jgi:hypothetical protein